MKLSLQLELAQACATGKGLQQGYAYFLDQDDRVCIEVLEDEEVHGSSVPQLLKTAQCHLGNNVLSALTVVRSCEEPVHEPGCHEIVRSMVVSRLGNIGMRTLAHLEYDEATGLGTFDGDGDPALLIVLPHVPSGGAFNVIRAVAPAGKELYVAQQQGAVLQAAHLRGVVA